MDLERDILNLITYSGEATSLSIEAIEFARNGEFARAEDCFKEADEKLIMAHKVQTSLMHREAAGETFSMSILLVHAQDHLMNSITINTLAKEFVKVFSELESLKKKGEA